MMLDLLGTGNLAGVRVVLGTAKRNKGMDRAEVIDWLAQLSGEAGIRATGQPDPLRFPRLRGMLEKIRVDDPDPQLRLIAAEVLKAADAP